MTMTLGMVTVDCADPVRLAGFWTAALGVEVVQNFEDAYLVLAPQEGTAVSVALQRVPDERAGKNRLHLDFGAQDRAGEVARLVGLGATELGDHSVPGLDWTVLADPEGNQFCVGTPH